MVDIGECTQDDECEKDGNCPGNGTCNTGTGRCRCENDGDCPGTCSKRRCFDGQSSGAVCEDDDGCPGGFCTKTVRTNKFADFDQMTLDEAECIDGTCMRCVDGICSSEGAAATLRCDRDGDCDVLFTGVFTAGNVRAFVLEDKAKKVILKRRKRHPSEVFSSPVGLDSHRDKLYVAQGDLDRIEVFRIEKKKGTGCRGFCSQKPLERSDKEGGSFPNDVVVVELGQCASAP